MLRRILVLGSGLVSKALVAHLCRRGDQSVTLASNDVASAQHLADAVGQGRCKPAVMDVTNQDNLNKLVRNHDVVVSLIPWVLHERVAKACISEKKNMVTTSYITPPLRALEKKVEDAGILVFNEIGFDPGLDHLSAEKIIDDVHSAGGTIESFVSMAAGLPAVQHVDNPLGYKFSWSPRGVLLAAVSPARFLRDNCVVDVPGGSTYEIIRDMSLDMFRGLHLQGVPNRDSVVYKDEYGLKDAHTVFRGSMRFPGFGTNVLTFRELSLLSQEPHHLLTEHPGEVSWKQFLCSILGCQPADLKESIAMRVRSVLRGDGARVSEALRSLKWLGFLSDTPISADCKSPMDALCSVLEEKLAFAPGERDMALLHHEFIASYAGRRRERITSKCMVLGDPYGEPASVSAMSRLVGTPCAVATELVLDGTLRGVGLKRPLDREQYDPLLAELAKLDIAMTEETEEL